MISPTDVHLNSTLILHFCPQSLDDWSVFVFVFSEYNLAVVNFYKSECEKMFLCHPVATKHSCLPACLSREGDFSQPLKLFEASLENIPFTLTY